VLGYVRWEMEVLEDPLMATTTKRSALRERSSSRAAKAG
jgi:hypothetical protein